MKSAPRVHLAAAELPLAERLLAGSADQVSEGDIKAIFGQGSNSHLANAVGLRYPGRYSELRRRAVELGLIGVRSAAHNKPAPEEPAPSQAGSAPGGEIDIEQLRKNVHRVEAEWLAENDSRALADPEIRQQLGLPPSR